MAQSTTPTIRRRLLLVSEVAEILGVHENRVRDLIACAQLRSVRLGDQGWHRVPRRTSNG